MSLPSTSGLGSAVDMTRSSVDMTRSTIDMTRSSIDMPRSIGMTRNSLDMTRNSVDMTRNSVDMGTRSNVDMTRSSASASAHCSSCGETETRPEKMQFVNSKCVVFTYFKGDVGSNVDEHFTRALSQPSNFTKECPSGTEGLKVVRTTRASSTDFPISHSAYGSVFPTPVSPLSRTCHFSSSVFPSPIPGSSLQDTWLSMNFPSRSTAYSPYPPASYFPYTAPPMYGYKQFW